MKSLLGHDGANEISLLLCALEHGRAEQQTRDTGCKMRCLISRSLSRSPAARNVDLVLPAIGPMASSGSGEIARF